MRKQSPNSQYMTYVYKKSLATKNYMELWGADAPSASPGSATAALLTNEQMVCGRKGPGYLERKFQGRNGPGNNGPRTERSAVFIRLGNEWLVQGTNGPGNESSRERIVLRTNIPDTGFWISKADVILRTVLHIVILFIRRTVT